MLRKILITIALLIPFAATADLLTLKKNAPKSYTVQKGDTLWDISGIFLNQPWLWPKLWRLNPEINNPHLIYPGDVLRLVFDEKGEPMLVKGKPELKWSPKVRTQLKDQNPITTLPFSVISAYMRYDTILSEQQIDSAPYVLGSDEGYKSNIDGLKIYVKGELALTKAYAIYDKGDEIIDPETEESLGFEAILVGTGKVLATGNDAQKVPSTIYLEGVKREVRAGAIALPVNEDQQYPAYFTMQPVELSQTGQIIKSASGVREFGKFEVVMVNRGMIHSIEQGDVFTIKRTSPGVLETNDGPVYTSDASRWHRMANADASDYQMPKEQVGTMMVFKSYESVSMALVLKSTKPVRIHDSVTAP